MVFISAKLRNSLGHGVFTARVVERESTSHTKVCSVEDPSRGKTESGMVGAKPLSDWVCPVCVVIIQTRNEESRLSINARITEERIAIGVRKR